MLQGFSLATSAGLCAALASVSSKLALEEGGSTISYFICSILNEQQCSQVVFLLRCAGVGLMLLFNALMWMLFTKSLQKCHSTVEATVINSSANFCFTALCGSLLFGEALSLMWWVGASLIILGVVLLSQDSLHTSQQKARVISRHIKTT